MENTKVYHSIFDLLSDNRPEFIASLTEVQMEMIKHCDDFQYFRYELHDNSNVTVFDSWVLDFGEIIGFDSLENIVHDTIEFLEDEQ